MNNCEIIKDLLPLYADDVLSEESKAFVSEHLADCESCKAEFTDMQSEIRKLHHGDEAKINALKAMKLKISKKVAVITCSAVACAVVLIWAFFTWQIQAPFNSDNIVVHPIGSIANSSPILDIRNNYYNAAIVQIGDELFLNFSSTLHTRFFAQGGSVQWSGYGDSFMTMTGITLWNMPNENNLQFAIEDEINRVYYMNANYNKLVRLSSDASAQEEAELALERAKSNAILIWER